MRLYSRNDRAGFAPCKTCPVRLSANVDAANEMETDRECARCCAVSLCSGTNLTAYSMLGKDSTTESSLPFQANPNRTNFSQPCRISAWGYLSSAGSNAVAVKFRLKQSKKYAMILQVSPGDALLPRRESKHLETWREGSRTMATIKDIAEKAGVAIATVDRVLHDRGRVAPETRQRILDLAKEMNYTPNSVGQGLVLRKKKWKLSFFIIESKQGPIFLDILKGAKEKAEELSQYGVEVSFVPFQFSPLSIDLATYQTDGIAVPGLPDDPYIQELCHWAHGKDIPVVCYNLPLDDSKYLAYVGCDYVQAGKMAAGLCAMATNERGKVGVLSVDGGNVPSFQRRMLGFQRELAEHYPRMEITATCCNLSERMVYQTLWDHPELDVIYLVNPGDSSACKIIKESARNPDIRIITNDLDDRQVQLLRDGVISATICQEPERQGSLPLEILYQYLVYKTAPAEKNRYTTLSIRMRQNV